MDRGLLQLDIRIGLRFSLTSTQKGSRLTKCITAMIDTVFLKNIVTTVCSKIWIPSKTII